MENKRKILIVAGGVADQYLFDTSVFWCQFVEDFGKYEIVNCALYPDGRIGFPKTWEAEELKEIEKYDIYTGGSMIKNMKIECIYYVPNSWKGLTTYRTAFELLGIPIVGPSSESQNYAFNKISCRARVALENIKIAKGCVVRYQEKDKLEVILDKFKEFNMNFPVVVKAPCEDDSLGIYVVREEKDLLENINNAFNYQNKHEILIEQFVVGREVRSAIMHRENHEVLFLPSYEYGVDPLDIRKNFWKMIDFKQSIGQDCKRIVRTLVEKEKDPKLHEKLEKTSRKIFDILNIHDFAVFDYRYNEEEEELYLLEVGLFAHYCPKTNVEMLAGECGIPLDQFMDIGFDNAVKRFNANKKLE
jgi:D-alanine-D-alanine ligase